MVDRDPVQEVGPETRERDGVPPVPVDEDVGIHRRPGRQGQHHGSPSTTPPGPSPGGSPPGTSAVPASGRRPRRRAARPAGCASAAAHSAAGRPARPSSSGCGTGSRTRRRSRDPAGRAAGSTDPPARHWSLPWSLRRRRAVSREPRAPSSVQPSGRPVPGKRAPGHAGPRSHIAGPPAARRPGRGPRRHGRMTRTRLVRGRRRTTHQRRVRCARCSRRASRRACRIWATSCCSRAVARRASIRARATASVLTSPP